MAHYELRSVMKSVPATAFVRHSVVVALINVRVKCRPSSHELQLWAKVIYSGGFPAEWQVAIVASRLYEAKPFGITEVLTIWRHRIVTPAYLQ